MVPALNVVAPENVLLPVMKSRPVPSFVSPPVPEMLLASTLVAVVVGAKSVVVGVGTALMSTELPSRICTM